MNGNNNRNNNDERLRSSLSSSVKERAMESEGNQLQVAREKNASMPSSRSSNGNVAPRGGGLPSKNSIGNNGNGLNTNKGMANKNALPAKDGLKSNMTGNDPLLKNKTPGNGASPKGGASNEGQALQNKVASKGLQAMGVPKKLSESAVNSKLGKKAMNMMKNPVGAALGGLKNAGKSEAEKDAAEQEEEAQEKEKRSGFITLRLPLKVKLIIMLAILPSFTFVILFLSIITAYVADEGAFNIFFGTIVSGGDVDTARDLVKFRDSVLGNGANDVGMGNSFSTYDEFLSRTQNLGNIYEFFDCESEEECLNRDEVKFYIKVNDISTRYKRKYNITLDWELLMATALSMDLDVKEMFVSFLNEYNYDDVEKYNILMNLDWDYDYKKIPGYTYLKSDDYQYDLQILAKNMVTKTTTQTCSKVVKNKDGSTSVVITKTKTDIDVEEQYFKPGQPYYLKCDAGETYDISSNYKLDLEKYDEFLLEYIEHKMYLPDGDAYEGDDPNHRGDDENPGDISTEYEEGNSLADNMVNLALSQKGVSGKPNKFTRWYGKIPGYPSDGYAYPWCATFVSWVVANTNYDGKTLSSIINYKSASTGSWARHFRDASNLQFKLSQYHGGNYKPKKGDIILFTWSSNPNQFNPNDFSTGFSHIGIVTSSDDNYVYTIEGNTSNTVAERKYKLDCRDIDGYGVWY